LKISSAQRERLLFLCRMHANIEDLAILTSALHAGHRHVTTLVDAGQKMMSEAQRLIDH